MSDLNEDEYGNFYLKIYLDEKGVAYVKDVYEGEEHLFEIGKGYAGLASEKELKEAGKLYVLQGKCDGIQI